MPRTLKGLGYLDDPAYQQVQESDPETAWNILESMRSPKRHGAEDPDLAAAEHEAFYRHFMNKAPALAAAAGPVAIPGYQAAKVTAQQPWTQPLLHATPGIRTALRTYGAAGGSKPSWHQMGAGYSGLVKGAKDLSGGASQTK